MSVISSSTLARLVDQIQADSQNWLSTGSALVIPPQQIVRKWSVMLLFRVKMKDGGAGAILVKIMRTQGGTIESAIEDKLIVERTKREYEMLRSVERIFSNENHKNIFCYIRPLAMLEEWNALVTEELNCRPLKEYLSTLPMLLGRSRHWQTFELLLERSAHWLRIYHHSIGVQEIESLQNTGVREKFDKYLTQVSGAMAQSDASQIREFVNSIIANNQMLRVPVAVLHGDFHCSNLLVMSDLRVGSLDAECVRGPIYDDIAKLLADLETRSLQVFTLGRLIPSRRMESLRAAILKGYFDSVQVNPFLLELFTALAILYKWKIDEDLLLHSGGIQRSVRKILSPLRRRYMLGVLNKHLEILAKQANTLQTPESGVLA